jgi:hypothetical protein
LAFYISEAWGGYRDWLERMNKRPEGNAEEECENGGKERE